ncbi:methyl-accepting chemotaxis protein [Duganella phyllosphaerae]|uniref:Aerotaxis receptor n=1 Tax=Duganella phyllosphaerae TaxID=762836 RepID=A0A1E7WUX5_9BURK|nr:methyl-accepting chemotaxis protein [Duganella phyllosphaerae]OFA03456.1 aerotaxis receptor [Duganella phyllosphaerae]
MPAKSPVDVEVPLLADQFLISRTDAASKISYVNRTFLDVSGFSEAELLGATNDLFRHPDMPDAVFADIWKTLKGGGIWSGIMKHRRKGGGFFWVQATISPMLANGRLLGYTTVRTRPEPALLHRTAAFYTLLRKSGRARGLRLHGGALQRTGLAGCLDRIARPTLAARSTMVMACAAAGLLCLAALPYSGAVAASLAALLFAAQLGAAWRLRCALQHLLPAHALCRKLSAGDLGLPVKAPPRGALDGLAASLSIMQQSLREVVRQVGAGSASVAAAARAIDEGNRSLSGQTEQQAAALQQAAATMAELADTVRQNAAGAGEATRLAGATVALATRGSDAVQLLAVQIEQMAAGAAGIAEFIDVIDGVAFQTNVLALNAAVEAARAGQEGRGFAVVAAEVRNLAQRSAAAAQQIGILIKSETEQIAEARRLGAQATLTLREVVQAAHVVSDLGGQIAIASAEQSDGIAQLHQAVANIDEATQRNAAHVEELSATAAELTGQSWALNNTLAVFHS